MSDRRSVNKAFRARTDPLVLQAFRHSAPGKRMTRAERAALEAWLAPRIDGAVDVLMSYLAQR